MDKKTIHEALKLIKIHGPIGPTKLAEKLQISTQMAHRHIKSLLKDNEIKKIGSPPKVFYVTTE
jgi:DNA-binding MarR family transcriptional regulator